MLEATPVQSTGRKILRALLPVLALLVGAGILVLLVVTRPKPQKKAREERGALVEVEKVHSVRERLKVVVQGTVVPAEEISLQPEVAGRVVWQNAELIPGGRFKKGEVLLRIDPRDYHLAVRQQNANVDRAGLELKLERSRREIAKGEWKIIGEDQNSSEEGRALALRKPQLDVARTNLEAAKSARAQAALAVSKTVLKAPFNGFVKSESVDKGQLVSPQMPLATLVGTDAFWVQVALPVARLSVIAVPGLNAEDGKGAAVTVVQEIGGKRIERPGRVVRLLGDLDPVGRMARLLVEIDDPLGLKKKLKKPPAEGEKPEPELPLLLGAFVEAAIEADTLTDVVELPRLALRDGDSVYVVDAEGRLAVRTVEVAWRREQTVLVSKGLAAGDEVIVSRLPSAVPGMLIRKAPKKSDTVLGRR